jgi:hypothetical protein
MLVAGDWIGRSFRITLPRIDANFIYQVFVVIENLSARIFRYVRSVKFSKSHTVALLPIVFIWSLFLFVFSLFLYSSRNFVAAYGMLIGVVGCEALLFSVLPVLVSD